jgi:hypothetical protein
MGGQIIIAGTQLLIAGSTVPGGTQLQRAWHVLHALIHKLCRDDNRHLMLHGALLSKKAWYISSITCINLERH